MILFLIGMPGSGKTTVGRELARALDTKLTDLDEYIVKKENLSIPQIFKTKGEDYFRKAETAALKELLEKNSKGVVSVGGGTPCFNNNMKIMSQGGKTIYLKATPETLYKRIEEDPNIRPLFSKLKGKKLVEKIISMLGHREKFYLQANFKIETDDRTAAEIAEEITSLIKS